MSIDHKIVVPRQKPIPKHLQDNPLGTPSLTMIVGQTGSGKSIVVANLLMALQKLHKFESGLFVTGNNKDPILESIELPIANTPTQLSDYITELKQSKEGTNHILVLDDIQGSPDFNIFSNRSEFTKFMLSHRHYGEDKKKAGRNGVWVIATAQTLKNSFSTSIRDQVKNWILYYPNRHPTMIKNYEDIAQDPVAMQRAMSIVKSKGAHSFLFLNKHNPEEDQYFLNFDEPLKDLQ